jgi:hypothetical protein
MAKALAICEPPRGICMSGPIRRTTGSHGLRGAIAPDAIYQAQGFVQNTMTQQATMLPFMDCFHPLAIVVLAGLSLAFLARRFEIGKVMDARH